jgi:hypothetical protein
VHIIEHIDGIDNVLIVAIAEAKSTALGKTYEIMSRFSTMWARINRKILTQVRLRGMNLFQRIQGKALLGACFLLTLSLSACDSTAPVEPIVVAPPATNGVTADVASEPIAQASKVAKKKRKEKPKEKLNLTLSHDVIGLSGVVENSIDANNLHENNALPNMFEKEQEGTTVGAGILRDAENEDYVDSIQGAEVNIVFKID